MAEGLNCRACSAVLGSRELCSNRFVDLKLLARIENCPHSSQ